MNVSLQNLIQRLNSETRSALESAAALCRSKAHYEIEVEHFLLKLLEGTDNDLLRIIRYFRMDSSRMASHLMKSLGWLKAGNESTPALSEALVESLVDAWAVGSLNYGCSQVRSGLVLMALCDNPETLRTLRKISEEMRLLVPETLRLEFEQIVAGSPESSQPLAGGKGGASPDAVPPSAGATPYLQQYTQNLTEQAKAGKLDPVYGRDGEIRQMIDILLRRRQNNPILTGEPGVGKTAVVEGFALRIAEGNVPDELKNVTLYSLDLTLLQAGAGVKGEFENRLKGLIAEVKSSPAPIILFIDEAHAMIGAGGQAGQGDAANILKPALARGELRTIAATTWSEYKRYFERDAALARRFQVVKVEEPDETRCLLMLRALSPALEKHHGVRILDDALTAAVRLSHRFITGRQLPDKAVSVLDTVCAKLTIGQKAMPATVQDLYAALEDLEIQDRLLAREASVGEDHSERLAEIAERRRALESELNVREARWKAEAELVSRIRTLRQSLEQGSDGDQADLRAQLASLNAELSALQGEQPMVHVCADGNLVGEVISSWTGIPAGKMMRDDLQNVLCLAEQLKKRVVGQDGALERIAERISTSSANLGDPDRPVGVFMLVGPSGVGKTETALSLADLLYGGERNLITINMSEFQEAHTVSTLKGAPPGYVGYGEGGVLTEAVRKRPYSVILLDEVEKAHPDVLELFYQVFDKGFMEDGEGREIFFRNSIILLTSNAASDTMMKLCADPETTPSAEGLVSAIRPELIRIFKPAFLGRMVVVPYYPVRDEALRSIVRLKLNKIVRRMRDNNKIALSYGEDTVDSIAARCTEVESGARNVDNILSNTILPDLSRLVLERMVAGQTVSTVSIGCGADGAVEYAAH